MKLYKKYLKCKKCKKRYGTDLEPMAEDGFCPICSPRYLNKNARYRRKFGI